MKTILTPLLLVSAACLAAVVPALYDSDTKKIVAPTNVLGMTFQAQAITDLVGYGLTNKAGVLMVDTNVIGTGGGGGGSGTVTSVGLTMPASIFDIAGTPVTGTGTFAVTFDVQAVNTVLAGPTSGGSAVPAFRLIADDDVPDSITVNNATTAATANSGDSATGFFTTGAVEDARIDVALARDSEVAATYAPLASPALTGTPTVPTAALGTSNTVAASTAFVLQNAGPGGGGTNNYDSLSVSNLSLPFANGFLVTDANSNVVKMSVAPWQATNVFLNRLQGIGAGVEGDTIYRDSVGWTNRPAGGGVTSSTGSTFTPNFASGRLHQFTMTGNTTLAVPAGVTTNMVGATFILEFIQDSTGSRTLTVPTNFMFGSEVTGFYVSTNAGSSSYATLIVLRTNVFRGLGNLSGYVQ
jgi:hypothetical protein